MNEPALSPRQPLSNNKTLAERNSRRQQICFLTCSQISCNELLL